MSPTDEESAYFWRCVSDDKDKRLAELATDLSSAREEIAELEAVIQSMHRHYNPGSDPFDTAAARESLRWRPAQGNPS